jgi:hypothetical protein
MMAMSKSVPDQEPGEIEMLLPWHAAGTLNARDSRRVDEALARDPDLARQYAVIQQEYAETIHLNESLGAPSARAMTRLFAAIDAEPARKPSMSSNLSAGITGFFAKLSPRALAWSASLGVFALLLQAGLIGTLMNGGSFKTASLSIDEPATRAFNVETPPRALVRFAPDARVADITAFLDQYQASIVGGVKGGLFRLQFGDKALPKDEVTGLMNKLQSEKIVSLAVATP